MVVSSGVVGSAGCTATALWRLSMDGGIDKVKYASMMYDFYGSLLSESQNEVMALYHEDNLSLSEIAEQLGMTRQAVHYTLKKAEKALEKFEEKLGLVKEYEKDQTLADEARRIIAGADMDKKRKDRLSAIIDQLSE